ncbi:MAG: Gfo/Idh/MocA family oxidoreductase [Candidatus Hatepunaea meridiana]|nr:Gfo/Idh/MocA family oxidoreductase [Candidatus Hatepunaea meridiana]
MDIRIAVIGMGYWGKNLVRNFHEIGVLKVICDSEASRRTIIEEKYPGVEFNQDFQSVLEDDSIQAVVIATPAVMHYVMVKQALEAGKDVFVEKPLALELAKGEELVSLAARRQRILMVGHILHYHPAVIKLKELINDGTLGRIQYIYSNRLNIGKIRTEENILWSFAPHDISVMLGLLGEEPCEVSCDGGAYLNKDIADVTMSQLLFPSGVRAHIHVSWLHPFKEQRLVVIGSEKMALFDDTAQDKLKVYPHRVEWKNRIPTAVKAEAETVELPVAEPLRSECEHFVSCVRNRTRPLTDGDEGLKVLRILNQCQQSMDDNPQPDIIEKPYFVHSTAVVDEPCDIGAGTKIWHFSHVMKGAKIGKRCIFGQNVNIDMDTVIGNNVKVQNNVSIYTGVTIEDDVFLGPSCVLTNVTNPRSQVIRHSLYEKTLLKRGSSIGANATIVCGITIGRYAFIGAGAVVAKDVPDYAMMVGVPARMVGWISRHGLPLKNPDAEGIMTCPESGLRYKEVEPGVLKCLDLDEEQPLPESMRVGDVYYDNLVHP